MENDKAALVLGGGGSRGAYEIGVWQALRELDMAMDIITGTSVGAINGAIIVQGDFDLALKLWHELETNDVFDVDLKDIIAKRGVGCDGLHRLLDEYISEDKIRQSPMDYGIVTAQLPAFTPHYLYKEDIPKGKMRDYILASAACFPALKSHVIDNTPFVDGAYIDNLPVGMALKKNAKMVIAVDLESIGFVDKKQLKQAENLKVISSPWDLGNFLIFDTNNSKRIIRLGYFDAMKAFDVFDGLFYTFSKNEFDKRTLRRADRAAKIFDLDPLTIYKEFSLNKRIVDGIKSESTKSKADDKKMNALLKGGALESFISGSKKINKRTVTLFLAKNLKEGIPEKSFLLSKPLRKLLSEEFSAAAYLHEKQLI